MQTLVQKIFDSLFAHIAIIDEEGRILVTNAAWKRFSQANGLSCSFKGVNYLSVCQDAAAAGDEDAGKVAQGLRDVIGKKTREFLHDYPCHSPRGKCWFYMRAVRMDDGNGIRVIVSHEDITQLKLTQESLQEYQHTLEQKNQSLEEANIALKVLIRQWEADKAEMEKRFLTHVRTFVLPHLHKIRAGNPGKRNLALLSVVEDQLNALIHPLMKQLSNASVLLTPQEMQVASLVKAGRTTGEIAETLYISEATVSFHRKNLRAKLGLRNKSVNLRSFLLSMS